jgi:hypothetical protein
MQRSRDKTLEASVDGIFFPCSTVWCYTIIKCTSCQILNIISHASDERHPHFTRGDRQWHHLVMCICQSVMGNGEWKVGQYHLYIHFHVTYYKEGIKYIHKKKTQNIVIHIMKYILLILWFLSDLSVMSMRSPSCLFATFICMQLDTYIVSKRSC